MWSLIIFACLMLAFVKAECPLCDLTTCMNLTALEESCPNELVYEPCGCCRICGSGFGGPCGGAYAVNGTCEYDLKCTADPRQYLNGVDIIGICTRKSCLKNCSRQSGNRVCGDDGRYYQNMCALRKRKFCEGTGVSLVSDNGICERACPELRPPKFGNMSYSNGLVKGSVANFSCHPPYILEGSVNRTCIEKPTGSEFNGTQAVCIYPCEFHTCDRENFKVCALDTNNETHCVCESPTHCLGEDDPVCASNGQTYPSECHMRVSACHNCLANPSFCFDVGLYVLSFGKCPERDEVYSGDRNR